jgi:hypothetical protein
MNLAAGKITLMLALALLLDARLSFAKVVLDASFIDPTGATVPISFLVFDLRDCGYNIPQVPSAPGTIVQKHIVLRGPQLPPRGSAEGRQPTSISACVREL